MYNYKTKYDVGHRVFMTITTDIKGNTGMFTSEGDIEEIRIRAEGLEYKINNDYYSVLELSENKEELLKSLQKNLLELEKK